MHQSQVSQWVARLTPILQITFREINVLPTQSVDILADSVQSDTTLIVDATEQEIQRPQDKNQQKKAYSGKKKHSKKHTLITDLNKKVFYVGKAAQGATHDKKMADNEEIVFNFPVTVQADLGYPGWKPKNATLILPHKRKNKKYSLNPEQQLDNYLLAKSRIKIEHTIASIKRCRIAKEIVRYKLKVSKNIFFLLATSLHNFRLNPRLKPP